MKPNRRRKAALRVKPHKGNNSTRGRMKSTKRRGGHVAKDYWHELFLKTLHETGIISHACRVVKVNRTTVYEHRNLFPEFGQAWDAVVEEAMDKAEREMYRRAVEGFDKPVYQGGAHVGTIREYSDTLLCFMLKGRRREVYGDKLAVDQRTNITLTPSKALDLAQKREASIIATMKAAAGIAPMVHRN